MATKKTWIRPTQITGFPKPKYGFREHLQKPGDWVETHPWTREEHIKFKKAALQWAARKRYKIKIYSMITADPDKVISGVILENLNRVRKENYDFL